MAHPLLPRGVRLASTLALACLAAATAAAAPAPLSCAPDDGAASDAPPITVEQISVVTDPVPAVVIHLSAPSDALARTLEPTGRTPRRIYLDVPHATLAHGVARALGGPGPILRVRIGQFGATARVVVEVARPVSYAVGIFDRIVTLALDESEKPGATPAVAPAEPPAVPSPPREEPAVAAAAPPPVSTATPASFATTADVVATAVLVDAAPPRVATVTPLPALDGRVLATLVDGTPGACGLADEEPTPRPSDAPPEPAVPAIRRVAAAPAGSRAARVRARRPAVAPPATPPRVRAAHTSASVASTPPAAADAPPAASAVTAAPVAARPVPPAAAPGSTAASAAPHPAPAPAAPTGPPHEAAEPPPASERPVAPVAGAPHPPGLGDALQALRTADDPLLRRAATVLGRTAPAPGVSDPR